MKAFVLVIGAALLLIPTAFGRHDAKPALTLVDRTPVVVRGKGFGVRERVLVRVETGILSMTQRTRATAVGSFVARFDGVRLTPCSGAAVFATGARGHVARLKLALRECPEPIIDP